MENFIFCSVVKAGMSLLNTRLITQSFGFLIYINDLSEKFTEKSTFSWRRINM